MRAITNSGTVYQFSDCTGLVFVNDGVSYTYALDIVRTDDEGAFGAPEGSIDKVWFLEPLVEGKPMKLAYEQEGKFRVLDTTRVKSLIS